MSEHMICCFCKSEQLSIKYKGLTRRYEGNKEPIDIYSCNHCHSLITFPLPSKEELAALYASYNGGMNAKIRKLRDNNPLTAWHKQCISRATKLFTSTPEKNSTFSWIDVGAGGGELAKMMALEFPKSQGFAIDFHDRPKSLDGIGNLTWFAADLNEKFSELIKTKIDLVMSITVIEHVLSPENFVSNCINLMNPDAALYITSPCADTLAQKVFGKRWPYIIPGEHLNIPSVKGMNILLRQLDGERSEFIFSKKTVLPYTLGYFLSFFNLSFLRAITPHSFPVKLPTGILEAGFESRNEISKK